jgi:hypothetical protein
LKSLRLFCVLFGILALIHTPAWATSIFTETFNYTVGSGLAGQNGGSGFSGSWTGGDSVVVNGIGSGPSALQIGTKASRRSLLSTSSTHQSLYLSYVMKASDFQGGNYVGISLWQGNTENMFLGIPYNSRSFGFDPHGGLGAGGIRAVNFTPATNTPYLVLFGLLPSAAAGKVDIKLWATSDLSAPASSLLAGAANAELIGLRDHFFFDTVQVVGNYAAGLKMSGLATATTASEAMTASAATVPEPSAGAMLLLGLGGVMAMRRRRGAV